VSIAESNAAPLLAGRTALVTGAATGIGRAIALALAGARARVAISHFERDAAARQVAAEAMAAGATAIVVEADVRRADQVAGMVPTPSAAWVPSISW
jgi:NAD(P)-dependent dehydrogenase (short-subunit alcohol dehydrogenase family)